MADSFPVKCSNCNTRGLASEEHNLLTAVCFGCGRVGTFVRQEIRITAHGRLAGGNLRASHTLDLDSPSPQKRTRISREEYLVERVKLASRRGTCNRSQVGCIVVKDGRVICEGYNGSPPGQPHCLDVGCLMEENHCVRTTHAEINALAFAARHGIRLEGCDLWLYGWDKGICHRCKKAVKAAGIKNIRVVPVENV